MANDHDRLERLCDLYVSCQGDLSVTKWRTSLQLYWLTGCGGMKETREDLARPEKEIEWLRIHRAPVVGMCLSSAVLDTTTGDVHRLSGVFGLLIRYNSR